jgi:hypothetical protein
VSSATIVTTVDHRGPWSATLGLAIRFASSAFAEYTDELAMISPGAGEARCKRRYLKLDDCRRAHSQTKNVPLLWERRWSDTSMPPLTGACSTGRSSLPRVSSRRQLSGLNRKPPWCRFDAWLRDEDHDQQTAPGWSKVDTRLGNNRSHSASLTVPAIPGVGLS